MTLTRKFFGILKKAKDNSVVSTDEFVVFLAQDDAFAMVLPLYYEKCVELGCDAEQITLVSDLVKHVNEWRSEHPDRCKKPDCKGEFYIAWHKR